MEYRCFENDVKVEDRAKPTYDNSEYHKRLARIINEPYIRRYEHLSGENGNIKRIGQMISTIS